MKLSLTISLAILAVAAVAGWRNHGELASVTRTYEQVSQQARALGIQTDSITSPRHTRPHQPRQLDAKSLAADLIAFARELEALPEPADAALLDEREQRMLDWQRRLSALDPAAMKSLIAEINTAADLQGESRQKLLLLVLQTLAESHPQAALEVLSDSPDLLNNPEARASAASIALIHGMETDPAATTAWFQNHRELFPGRAEKWVTERLLRGTSLINPKLAFQLIGELGISDAEYAVRMITNPARNAAQRTSTLAAFREYLATVPDPARRKTLASEGISSMISVALFDGVERGTAAIGNGLFTPEEIEEFAERHFGVRSSDEQRKYLDWLIRTIPTEKTATEIVPQQFFGWVQADYQAAGIWLSSTADGPAKTAATATYASALASYHPATAAQWALTLPSGEARDRLLPQIYQSWSKTDPAAAADFADHNGIAR